MKNNYKNWDFYCINFLISDMELRNSLNSLSSKKKKDENKLNFFLSEIEVNKPLFSVLKKNKISEKEKKLSIFFTNKNNQNFINTLIPYKVIINHRKFKENNKGFKFDFNFKEMKKLLKIYFKWNLVKFFKKNININYKKELIDIDKIYLNIMEDNFLNYVVDYEEYVKPENQYIHLEIV